MEQSPNTIFLVVGVQHRFFKYSSDNFNRPHSRRHRACTTVLLLVLSFLTIQNRRRFRKAKTLKTDEDLSESAPKDIPDLATQGTTINGIGPSQSHCLVTPPIYISPTSPTDALQKMDADRKPSEAIGSPVPTEALGSPLTPVTSTGRRWSDMQRSPRYFVP